MIVAHNNFYILEKLIRLIDDERNDIYLHIDEKVKNFPVDRFAKIPAKSKIFFVPRVDVNWGGFSLVQAELELLRQAVQGNYDYYHLLSGVDLPIKTQDYIHDFFAANRGKEFIGFSPSFDYDRVAKIWLFMEYWKTKNPFIGFLTKVPRNLFLFSQKACGYDRTKNYQITFKKGPNWFSITDTLAKYVIANENLTEKYFKYNGCSDEHFLQTMVFNSPFKNNIHDIKNIDKVEDENLGCMRHIDWRRGKPYVFRSKDYDELLQSDRLFARKFDVDTDKEIIDKIFAAVSRAD
ncbi:MAG: beta-1,6-N-acetylglucosaminyltransferase [Negativicutes bacterium]|nr:beta-1,6-N-acetylglucosaminyltransferase [Negativicutes bacterium]